MLFEQIMMPVCCWMIRICQLSLSSRDCLTSHPGIFSWDMETCQQHVQSPVLIQESHTEIENIFPIEPQPRDLSSYNSARGNINPILPSPSCSVFILSRDFWFDWFAQGIHKMFILFEWMKICNTDRLSLNLKNLPFRTVLVLKDLHISHVKLVKNK